MALSSRVEPELFIKIADVLFKKLINYFINGTFYLSGEAILPHLLCCSGFAVKYHSFIPCALYLRQPLLVNSPGKLTCFFLPLFLEKIEGNPKERDKEKISCKMSAGFFILAGEGDFN